MKDNSLQNQPRAGRRLISGALIALAVVLTGLAFLAPTMQSSEEAVNKKPDIHPDWNKLTAEEERVIVDKGTERPFTGEYYDFQEAGTYTCKRCGAELYKSADKFDSHCGWPSFDDEIPGAVKRTTDADGMRTEITCTNCGAHLGHVFLNEGFTEKNVRHCVNSISLNFVPAGDSAGPNAQQMSATTENKTQMAYFAGGCFWGVEYMIEQQPGVISATSGYMGGHTDDPSYKDVSYKNTGHAETVAVEFDPTKTDFETLARYFFEIHDPTQVNRQGPDVGDQYRSAIFYTDDAQKATTEKLIGILKDKGYDVVTEVAPAGKFYTAEEYHQDYYEHKGSTPYCHFYTKRF